MSISANFNVFCDKLKISPKKKSIISLRYNSICKKLNNDFWDLNTNYGGIYVGCFGKETANDDCNSVDMIFEMPSCLKSEYTKKQKNGQFMFLENVRRSIAALYPNTSIKQNEFGIKVCFFDGICFNIIPVFFKNNTTYIYADPRKGGSWKTKNFKRDIEEIKIGNIATNQNLSKLCRMIKSWKHHCKVPIEDILIDTLAYRFLLSWRYNDSSYSYYDLMCKDFFKFLMNQKPTQKEWKSIGGFLVIPNALNFRYKAIIAHHKAKSAMDYSKINDHWLAALKWKEVFGEKFPTSIGIETQLNTLKDSVSKVYSIQKKCTKIVEQRRYLFMLLQVISAILVPVSLFTIEYTKNFYLGAALFLTVSTVFILSVIYKKANKIKVILRHKASASIALKTVNQINVLLRDLHHNDVDVAIIRDKQKLLVSRLETMYKGTSLKISKKYVNAINKLDTISPVRKKHSDILSAGITIPEWHKHKFHKENYIQNIVNYRN